MRKFSCFVIGFLMIALAASCSSSGTSDVTQPTETGMEAAAGNSHQLWGYFQFKADPKAQTLDVVPLRDTAMHLNTLVFLEPPPLVNLTLESLQFNGNIIEAGIGLRHPFLGLTEFTGFDVCGLFITNGSITGFSDPDLRMAGAGDTRLLNPDGYSRWWNPAEFPHGNTMFSYKDGLLGTPDSTGHYNSTLNAYKYFCDDLTDPNDTLDKVTIEKRGLFSAGQKNIRHYTIELGTGGLIFNYAVDASWQFPSGLPPWTAPDDFPPAANRPEAWRISIAELWNTLYYENGESGGDLSLAVDVYDHFNADKNKVRVEATGAVPMTESTSPIGSGEGYSTYQVDISDCTPSAAGDLGLLVTVESDETGYGGLLPGKPVSAYFTYTTQVNDHKPIVDPWSEEFEISGSDGRFPVIAQTASGRVLSAWSTDPGIKWSEFTFPATWGASGIVTSSVDTVRMSIAPGISGDEMVITTQNVTGSMYIGGVLIEYGHPLLYKWDGSTGWDVWDTPLILSQLMHHTMVDSEGKYQWFWVSCASYGNTYHAQFTNWAQNSWYDYLNSYEFYYPNSVELGYSRCWDDDSAGNAYFLYEGDRAKNPYGPPQDLRGILLAKQSLPLMYDLHETYYIEQTSDEHCDSPSLAIDSTDRLHVAYRRYVDSTSQWQVVHRWSDDAATWSSINETIVWSGSTEPEWRYISLDTDSQDRLHLTFLVDGNIYYTRSDDGLNWLPLEWVNESIEDLLGVADHQQWMFVDAASQVHVVWARLVVSPGVEFGAIRHRWREALP